MKTKKTISIICVIMSVMLAFCGLAGCTPQEKPENKDPREEYINKLEQYTIGANGYGFHHDDEDFVIAFLERPESLVYKEKMEIIRCQGVERIKTAVEETEWKEIVYNTTKEIYFLANSGAYYESGFKFKNFYNSLLYGITIPEKRKEQAEKDVLEVFQKQGNDKIINDALLNWLSDRLYYYSCSEYKTRFVPGLVMPQEFYFAVLDSKLGYYVVFSDEHKSFTYDLYYTNDNINIPSLGLCKEKGVPGKKINWKAVEYTYFPKVTHFMAIVYDEGEIAGYVLFKYTTFAGYGAIPRETSSITVDASVLFEKDEEGKYPKIESNFFDGLLSVYEEQESFVNAQTIYKEEDDGKYTHIHQLHFPLYTGSDEYEYEIRVEKGEIFELENFNVITAERCKWERGSSAKTLTVKPGARIGLSEMGENELTVTLKEKTTGKAIKKAQVLIKKNEGHYDYTYYVNEVE